MPTTTVTTQNLNANTRLLTKAQALLDGFFNLLEEKKKAALLGIPAANNGTPPNDVVNYPLPGDQAYLDRSKLMRLHAMVDLLDTWMNTDNTINGATKKPLDALVEALP